MIQRPKLSSNNNNSKKMQCSQKGTGKKNPRSKKIHNVVINKTFAQDQTQSLNIIQEPNDKDKVQLNAHQKFDLSPLQTFQRIQSENDKTERKPTLLPMTQPNEGQTVVRNKKLKTIGPKSKRNEYVYIVDPQSQKMRKYLIHQDEDINVQLNNKQEYVPPFQSCDEDCQSTEQIVRKGVEYSKKDLITQVERRNRLMTLRMFNDKRSKKSQSSTDSKSVGK